MEKLEKRETDAAVIADLATSAMDKQIQNIDGRPFIVLNLNEKVEHLSSLLSHPHRKTGTVSVRDLESFRRYFALHVNPNTVVYAHRELLRFAAVFDDHGVTAGWREHRLELAIRESRSWQAWRKHDGKQLGQQEFAEFLEDRAEDIVAPDAAAVVQAALTLQSKKSVSFRSGIDLSNGAVQFMYDEEIESKGKGNLTVPSRFILELRPVEDLEPRRIDVRLRYRISEAGKLSFVYNLVRADELMDDLFGEATEALNALLNGQNDEGGVKIINGPAS